MVEAAASNPYKEKTVCKSIAVANEQYMPGSACSNVTSTATHSLGVPQNPTLWDPTQREFIRIKANKYNTS